MKNSRYIYLFSEFFFISIDQLGSMSSLNLTVSKNCPLISPNMLLYTILFATLDSLADEFR